MATLTRRKNCKNYVIKKFILWYNCQIANLQLFGRGCQVSKLRETQQCFVHRRRWDWSTHITDGGRTEQLNDISMIFVISRHYLSQMSSTRLYVSRTGTHPWTEVLDKELEDSRKTADPLLLYTIPLSEPATSRYVKFELVSWWG